MNELFAALAPETEINPQDVAVRLLLSVLLGAAVAWVYRATSRLKSDSQSLPATLVLLSLLIAMVTQVVGNNVARAFSLVGALSIVRFRTVVRDTRDTAFVIFSVIVGMAVGARHPWVAVIGILVGAATAFAMDFYEKARGHALPVSILRLRVMPDVDVEAGLTAALADLCHERTLVSAGTAKRGEVVDFVYELRLAKGVQPADLLRRLSPNQGWVEVRIAHRAFDGD